MTTPRLPMLHTARRNAIQDSERWDQGCSVPEVGENWPLLEAHQLRKAVQPRPDRPHGRRARAGAPRRPLADASNYSSERPRGAIGRTRSDHSLRGDHSTGVPRSVCCSHRCDSPSSQLSASPVSSVGEPDLDCDAGLSPECGICSSAATGSQCRERTSAGSGGGGGGGGGGSSSSSSIGGSGVCSKSNSGISGSWNNSNNSNNTSRAYFAMGCYWHAEAVYGGVEGVCSTKVGFVDAVEVVQVQFDSTVVSYAELLRVFREGHQVGKRWANKKFQSAIFASKLQRAEAKAGCGSAAVHKLGSFRAGKESDQLYHLRQKLPQLLKTNEAKKLNLSAAQLSRINHCIAFQLPYEHMLIGARDRQNLTKSGRQGSPDRTDCSGQGDWGCKTEAAGCASSGSGSLPSLSDTVQSQVQPPLRCPFDGGPCTLPLGHSAVDNASGTGAAST